MTDSPVSRGGVQRRRLAGWLLFGEWRSHPIRALTAIVAIAIGVSLGFAIHLINAAAFNEFSTAVKSLSGQADVQVSGTESNFDEAIYATLAQRDGVAVASPVLQIHASVPGQRTPLEILGIDMFRAGSITPDLMGIPAEDHPMDALADDTVFLSAAAQTWLNAPPGGTVRLQAGTQPLTLRVAGPLARARAGQRLGVMDLGTAQWRFNRLGKLTRIDLKLRDGVARATFKEALARDLERAYPGRFHVGSPNDDDQNSRNDNMSRAYRVNLSVLALVALFTGAFLVFSTQALSVIRRRSQFALLRVLGLERGQLLRQVMVEGLSLGVAGSVLGVAAGYGLAAGVLQLFGGDLGAGLFSGVQPEVQFTPVAALVYFALGVGVSVLGSAAPAMEAARARPAIALKAGAEEAALARFAPAWPGLVCLALAALLSQLPPLWELPIFGYLSIALMLVGAIALMPRLAGLVFRQLASVWQRGPGRNDQSSPVMALTLSRLANAPGQAGMALGGVLSSFSLMVAMAIMVASFRVSVDQWLLDVLPADLYAASATGGGTAGLTPDEQQQMRSLPGIAKADFLRAKPLQLDPARPPVLLMARNVDAAKPESVLAMAGPALPVPAGRLPAWISEPMADLYNVHPGATLTLPLAGVPRDFFVAGIWRDYARTHGAVQIRLSDYQALTGDMDINNVALWLAGGARMDELKRALKALPFGASLELNELSEIRTLSMKLFDRSFAITYLLELIAIVIGLVGVAATFSAQTFARAREFGMLRHIGVTRRQILAILSIEGGALTGLGIATGFVLGWVISLVLVFIVNPQSFHWTMQLHLPWTLLGSVAAALLAASALTALASGRRALSGAPIRAVREDW
ncbi:FtsX-like permease family protein [Duganella sp. FT92W]|uniref:FtsX-like permease family protein n=1 Tax=Pseudoduganella rivuli TaxID=2666085 RepID=A0A7X2IRG5_9BURK|nr:FtsX-like permease family protein [Pseudoduganella rivuli]MRV74681.1 FtsX-like permease family protein [Pseudoduganella rivuli]